MPLRGALHAPCGLRANPYRAHLSPPVHGTLAARRIGSSAAASLFGQGRIFGGSPGATVSEVDPGEEHARQPAACLAGARAFLRQPAALFAQPGSPSLPRTRIASGAR